MGFYDLIYKCGCVGMSSSLDDFKGMDFPCVCDEHKLEVGKELNYNLHRFKRIHGANNLLGNSQKVKILDIKTSLSRNWIKLVKMEVFDFDTSILKKSKNIYYSEYDEEPSFVQNGANAIIIEIFEQEFIQGRKEMHIPPCGGS